MIADSIAPRRLSVVLLTVFAGIALVLASVGIYGVMSFLVVQRTHEIGVRMALGAQRSDVLRLIIARAGILIGAGTLIGLIIAFFSTSAAALRALRSKRARPVDILVRHLRPRTRRAARELHPSPSRHPRRSDDRTRKRLIMMTGPLIRLNHIERCYPLGKQQFFYVLRDINLEVEEGDFVSVMGPSGAGKSTLLHLLGMHDFGWTGEYFLDETAVHRLKPKERTTLRNEQIGFVFQNYNLLDDLTVYENLDIPLSYRRYGKSERSALVADTLDRFSIVGKKDLYPRQLSGGQQQLVSIARAIIAKPKLILADEPTGNLHSSQAEEIMQLFKRA